MRLFLVIALMLTQIAVFAQDQTAKDVARKAMPSVVLLIMEDKNGQPLKMGSGWVIKEGIIVTNFHVISGTSGGYIKVVGDKKKLNIEGIVAEDAVHDIALLSIKDLSAQPLTLSENPKQDIGETVFAIGNPKGLEGTFSQGIISGLREIENDKLLQITAPISPGSSGGPVLNSKSEVIGVSVATLVGGQNLNFAIPVSFAKEALLKMKPVIPLDSSTKEKKT